MKYILQRVKHDRGYLSGIREQIPDLIEIQDSDWNLEYAEKYDFPRAFATFMECLHLGRDTAGGYVHLEDDIILCKNFKERIEAKIIEVGDIHVIRFFSRHGDVEGFGTYTSWNQCTYFPQWICGTLISYFENRWSKRKKPAITRYSEIWYWDLMVSNCLKSLKKEAYICVPSYVEHGSCPSTLGNRPRDRQCGIFIDDVEE